MSDGKSKRARVAERALDHAEKWLDLAEREWVGATDHGGDMHAALAAATIAAGHLKVAELLWEE